MDKKSKEEKDFINLKKSPKIQGGIARGLTLEEATESWANFLKKLMNRLESLISSSKNGGYSKISQKCFEMLEQKLQDKTIYYFPKTSEYKIFGKNVDCYIEETKTVIEFYGDYWHRNPEIYEGDHPYFKLFVKDKWKKDELRIDVIKESNEVENIIIIWEKEFRKNPTKVIENIIKEIGCQN